MTFTRSPLTAMPIGLLVGSLLFLSACGHREEGTRADSYDMAGDWTFEVPVGNNVTRGAISLTEDGAAYAGTLTTDQGNNILRVQSLTLTGRDIVMTVKSPQGDVVFEGSLDPSSDSFSGTVTYHDGQIFPMQGERRRLTGGEG